MIAPVASKSVSAKPVVAPAPDPALRKAAEAFEAVLLRELIGTMRKAKLGDDLFGSSATDNFRQMADANTADAMAKIGAFGIADLIEKQLSQPPRAIP